ncbi:MAG: DNA repair protein RadA [Cyclobacteriaceae bacterium]|nr:DNA repair protein RadA [Cyclobacteriaceae bacterium]
MNKSKTIYFCKSCGYESAKWMGKCPSCQEWNSFTEETKIITPKGAVQKSYVSDSVAKPLRLSEVEGSEEVRLQISDQELSRVLGGGIVPGSVVLLGGEPGIGKSTLMLQLASSSGLPLVMYISGEESVVQIKMRAERMGLKAENCLFYTETDTQKIFNQLKKTEPSLVVIDSIQTLVSTYAESTPGSVTQIRQCTSELIRYAKETATPVILVGHITKEGVIAGPKVLEHMVDTVLQFEGDRHFSYRILRTVKNRFGSTAELGIYEMQGSGLREVNNPSEVLISPHGQELSGVAISAMLEGNRPFLIETQSLVSPAAYGNPQRSGTGYDTRRLNMLLAVLERRCGFRLGVQDVFLNMAGGLKVVDPGVDLAICMSLISSLEDIKIPAKTCFAAEIGLGGELRSVNKIENRIAEAEKLGFETIYIAVGNILPDKMNRKITITAFSKLQEVIGAVFG